MSVIAPQKSTPVSRPSADATHTVRLRTRLMRYRWLYLMLLPGLVYFAVFKYAPMYGVTLAFKDYVPFLGWNESPWVGTEHFERLFTSPDFPRILGNTLFLAFLHIVIVFPAPIVVALMLNEVRRSILKRMIQTTIYIPHFLSWTIVASLTYLLFALGDGPVTVLAENLFGSSFAFLTDPEWFRPLIIFQTLWKTTGWGTIIYLAALAGVDASLYEAARIDGANRFQQMWHITLPAIRSTIVIMLILTSSNLMDTGFEQIYLMTNSLNRDVAEVFDTYVYFTGIAQGQYSYSTAIGLFKGVVGLILVFGTNWLAKRFKQSTLF
ncbi:ABC transporter permease [Streptomyces radicis]|uniref:Sugar ABC transporter permease n=1 Tax=Streptomyces radicis TaxID=1750517 RepID=A0A3A9WLH7_9ACTN|nr:ABC transporter permease subunit [Streptomyces radicis]RKN07007.1 sugar ABC transporter permease [Streptomyces radicis]RKN15853.1 sugar ABC transporter permease [Streptomyces radicis]